MLVDENKLHLPKREDALPGRATRMPVAQRHAVLGGPMQPPWPAGAKIALFGLGCFWGAERTFWLLEGVLSTMVGFSGGSTPNPTYEEVCTGRTGHAEVVRIVFDPNVVSYTDLLRRFWEAHDPTQGMRQADDVGTQYRSGIYAIDETQRAAAEASRDAYQRALTDAGRGAITTEIVRASEFFYAEDYHQQYLHKNPGETCAHGGTGVACPAGAGVRA